MRLQGLGSARHARRSERLDHDEHHDRDHHQGRQLVDNTEKPRECANLPAAKSRRQRASTHETRSAAARARALPRSSPAASPRPRRPPAADAEPIVIATAGSMMPRSSRRSMISNIAARSRAGRRVRVIDEEPRQIEQPRHPGDDRDDMQRLDPGIGRGEPADQRRSGRRRRPTGSAPRRDQLGERGDEPRIGADGRHPR